MTPIISGVKAHYVVKSPIRVWDPLFAYFSNHLTLCLKPIRSIYNNTEIGGNVRFVVEFVYENDGQEVVPLHANDWKVERFKNFQLTQEALKNKDSLEHFMRQQIDAGTLTCKKFIVTDMHEWRTMRRSVYSDQIVEAKVYGTMTYHLFGKLATISGNRRRMRRAAKAEVHAKTPDEASKP